MTLVKKNKVEKSSHFEEIVTRLSRGESARSVSKWLKNKYGEDISHAAIARYNKNYLRMEEKVEALLNQRAEEKKKKLQKQKEEKFQTEKKIQQEAHIESEVQHEVDKIESGNENIKTVSEIIADNMQGVAKVAAQFPEKFNEACKDAKDKSNKDVTSKDVARLALDANKLYNDYFKQDGNIEITEGFEELANAIHKSRQAIEKTKEL